MTSSIYFLSDGGKAIKVGFSASGVERRIKQLSTGSAHTELIGSVPATPAQERALHVMLAAHRVRGEWFVDCHDVREVVDRCLSHGAGWIEPLKPKRERNSKKPDALVLEAQSIARAIIKWAMKQSRGDGRPTDQWVGDLAVQYGIKRAALWQLAYRPKVTLGVEEYESLIAGAQLFFADLEAELERDIAPLASALRNRREMDAQVRRSQARLREIIAEAQKFGINTEAAEILLEPAP